MNESLSPQSSSSSLFALQEKMQKLDQRVERIEKHLHFDAAEKVASFAPQPTKVSIVSPPTIPAPIPAAREVEVLVTPVVKVQESWRATPAAPLADVPESQGAPSQSPSFSLGEWENLIGGKWALWVGSLCLFLAMASFLAYTWASLPPAPPWAKVMMGLGSGFALLGASGYLRTRTQRYFSEGISGAGLAICYLSLWAGGQYFSVLSHGQSFCGMALLTALGVFLAVRYDALSLSVLSTLGGFLTPVLLQSGGGSSQAVPFLSYLALLNTGILGVSLWKRWRGLVWFSFSGTLLLVGGWALGADLDAMRGTLFFFLTLYFLLFLGASCFYSLFHGEETAPEDLLLLFAASSLYALAGYALLRPIFGSFPSAFPLALAGFFGALNVAVTRLAPRNVALRYSAGGLALLGVTVAVPLQFRQGALTIGWVVEAAILLFLSGRLNSALLRRAGQSVWFLTSIPLLRDLSASPTASSGLFSAAALPLAVSVFVSGWVAWNARWRSLDAADADELEDFYTVFSVAGGALLIGQEIYRFFALHHAPASHNWAPTAYFAIAGALGFYALAAFVLGLKWRWETVRATALTIAALAGLGTVATALFSPDLGQTPLWNERAVAFVLVGGVLAMLDRILKSQNETLSSFEIQGANAWTVGTAIFLLIAASLELFSGFYHARAALGSGWQTAAIFALSIEWIVAATLGLFLGLRWRQESLRALALFAGSCALLALGCNALTSTSVGLPLFNWRFGAFAIALAGLNFASISLRRNQDEISEWERTLPVVFRFVALGLLLWVLTQESYELSRFLRTTLGANWPRWAQMLVSSVWSLFGALLLLGGIHRRDQSLRLAALGLLCATVIKVFLFDLGFLNGPSRVLSLGGLGVSLIFISWLYSRFGNEKASEQSPEAL